MIHVSHAWLQKHPTPAASGGEFHWYPARGHEEVRASLVERLATAPVGAMLWRIAPGEVAWAQTFAATAPDDGRRYTGVAAVIAHGDAGEPTSELIERVVPPNAEPWESAGPEVRTSGDPASTAVPRSADPRIPGHPDPRIAGSPDPRIPALVRALLDGGVAAVLDERTTELPRLVARVERELPALVQAKVRVGAWVRPSLPPDLRTSGPPDPLCALCAAAIERPASRSAMAWQLACALVTPVRSIDGVFSALGDDPGWRGTLHAWGRGRLDRSAEELADWLALRVLAALVADRDPAGVIAEARWYALLPAWRRDALFAAVAARTPILQELADA
jgi:hypothetical protein